jgi:hypothetical protein
MGTPRLNRTITIEFPPEQLLPDSDQTMRKKMMKTVTVF